MDDELGETDKVGSCTRSSYAIESGSSTEADVVEEAGISPSPCAAFEEEGVSRTEVITM